MVALMNRHLMAWALGSTACVLAVAAWFMLQQPAVPLLPKRVVAQPPVAAVKAEASATTAAPPDLSFLEGISTPSTPKKKGKPPAQDPAARAALRLVGVDATAEIIWQEAINNPQLSQQERQDLIEDLNEDGLPKEKNITRADLPMIRARLQIIDRLMPEAMDQINADAFAEARKDLLNMQAKLGE